MFWARNLEKQMALSGQREKQYIPVAPAGNEIDRIISGAS